MRPFFFRHLFSTLLFQLAVSPLARSVPAVGGAEENALNVLQGLPTGDSFCSALLNGRCCPVTRTKDVVITQTEAVCRTVTSVEITTEPTETLTKSKTLRVVTVSIYSTSVLVPSGTSPIVNKRGPSPAPNKQPRAPFPAPSPATPTALAAYSPAVLSAACSSYFYPRCTSTTTIPETLTKQVPCTSTSTSTKTKYLHTTTYIETIYPAPDLIFPTGTLTTTVPAACAATTRYYPHDSTDPDTFISIADYPYYPQTDVECCAICYKTKNCIASAYFSGSGECNLLLTTKDQGATGESKICPLGVYDYPFGKPNRKGDIFVGPCGR